MAGDEDGGEGAFALEVGVDGEEAFDAAGGEDFRVGAEEVGAMAMVDGDVEVAFAHEEVAGAREDLGVVALAELGEEDADGFEALALKFAGDHAGLVVELPGGGADTLAGGVGDGAVGRVIEDDGDGGGAEVEVVGEEFEAGAWWRGEMAGGLGGALGGQIGHGLRCVDEGSKEWGSVSRRRKQRQANAKGHGERHVFQERRRREAKTRVLPGCRKS